MIFFSLLINNIAKTWIEILVKKKLKSFNNRKISGKNYFGEEFINK